jgi:DNA-binding transcriptional MerR regulator
MTMTTQPVTLSSAEVCRQTGLTYRQLDLWCRNGYLQPDQPGKLTDPAGSWVGSGHERVWSPAEVDVARMMARLVALGVTTQQAAKVARDPDERLRWLTAVWVVSR